MEWSNFFFFLGLLCNVCNCVILVAHGLLGLCLNDIIIWSQAYISDFRAANEPGDRDGRLVQQRVVRWIPPQSGLYKLNADVAIDGVEAAVGIGLAITY